jgi:hypothetical protein
VVDGAKDLEARILIRYFCILEPNLSNLVECIGTSWVVVAKRLV